MQHFFSFVPRRAYLLCIALILLALPAIGIAQTHPFVTAANFTSLGTFTTSSNATINCNTGLLQITGGASYQGVNATIAGQDFWVFSFSAFTQSGGTLSFTNTPGTHKIAIVATGNITVAGTINASGSGAAGGPGGSSGVVGNGSGTGAGTADNGGGSGGGNGGAGGAGGTTNNIAGGVANGNLLTARSTGGSGGWDGTGAGGGAGGGLLLGAGQTLAVSGTITANGSSGNPGGGGGG